MTSEKQLPMVGIICDLEQIGPHPFHVAGDKYVQAIAQASHCLPMLIPALGESLNAKQLVASLDGLLLTGGYSMVNPLHYQKQAAKPDTKLDTDRDITSFSLIHQAIEQKVPLLGICRGFQEMNVALGGSLHQELHENGHYIEHREDTELSLEEQYADNHQINLTKDGQLAQILDKTSTRVNSLHTQGVDRLGDQLAIEAFAEDGLVEAFSITNANTFAMAVQWHPEWQVNQNPDSSKLFHAFGEACISRQKMRMNHG